MDEKSRVEIAQIVGWLQGFSTTVWMLTSLTLNGNPVVDAETCAEYDEKLGRMAKLIGVDADGDE